MTHLIADSAIYQNILLDGSSGGVTSLYFTNSWASSSQRAHGVDIQGATGNVNDINFNGCRIRENSEIGINIASGANIAILNSEVSASSASSDNTWDNIVVGPGVSEFRIIDNRIGLFATAQTNRPRYGIIVNNGGSDNFQIIGNDLRGNGTAPLTIGGATGPNRRIVGNLPTSIVDQ
jgi:hypothetical protein